MTTQTSTSCPVCHGKGSYSAAHNWSDGWGMTEFRCDLCDGSGEVENLVELARSSKRRAEKAEDELRNLKVAAALYFSIIETGAPPSPALKDAPKPSPYAETWADAIHKAVKDLPRL